MISHTLHGPFPSETNLMCTQFFLTFNAMFQLIFYCPSDSYNVIMVPNLTILQIVTSFYNTAFFFAFPAHTHHHKMAKLNALFAQSMTLFEHFLFSPPCHPNFGPKHYAQPPIYLTYAHQVSILKQHPFSHFFCLILTTPSFAFSVVFIFPIFMLHLLTNYPQDLFHVFS